MLQGYSFELIQKYQSYNENQPVYYLNITEPDMQEVIRFAEITHANNVFAFVTLGGVADAAALAAAAERLPMLQTLNVAKFAAGMEQIPRGRIYAFSQALQFDRLLDVYTAEALGANPDIQKLQFDLKFGQPVPRQNEEGYNPNNPVPGEDGQFTYRLRGRRFRRHPAKYAAQEVIVWAQDAAATRERLQRLDDYVRRGVLVVAALPQLPVFDDELRFQQEQIDSEARKDLPDDITEEDRKTLEEERRKKIGEQRLECSEVEVVDFATGPATEGYFVMTRAARGRAERVEFEELEARMPPAPPAPEGAEEQDE